MGKRRINIVCCQKEIIGDMETPLSFYSRIRNEKFSFLLESLEGGEKWARFSFIGYDPLLLFFLEGDEFKLHMLNEREHFKTEDPLNSIKEIMKKINISGEVDLPRLAGGAVGYISYDVVRFFEKLPDFKKEKIPVPEIYFIIPSKLIVFDNLKHSLKILSFSIIEESEKMAKKRAEEGLEEIMSLLEKENENRSLLTLLSDKKLEFSSNFTYEEFLEKVQHTKELILEGEAIQVVLSQRFECPFYGEPLNAYRALRIINPSPYMYFLKYGEDFFLAGSSPEIMARVNEGTVIVRPIAGTRPRGRTETEDIALERNLLADEKEGAEHLMLVDLGRNDIGRTCEKGTVKVEQFKIVERYSHVMHLVSHVTGKLKNGADAYDVFRSTFPAGTVTGAPKVRAMEIIEEMENVKRGIYAGAVGYFDLLGNMDMAITIRTILFYQNRAYVQAGAGIVADSDPHKEYEETLNKAKALFRAIEVAQK